MAWRRRPVKVVVLSQELTNAVNKNKHNSCLAFQRTDHPSDVGFSPLTDALEVRYVALEEIRVSISKYSTEELRGDLSKGGYESGLHTC